MVETTLDMRIYLLDAKKFCKKKGFGFYGKIPPYPFWKLNFNCGVYNYIMGRWG